VADTPRDAGADVSTEVDFSVALDSDSDSPAGGGERFGVVRNAGVPRRAGGAWGGAGAGAPSGRLQPGRAAGGACPAAVCGEGCSNFLLRALHCGLLRALLCGCKHLLRAGHAGSNYGSAVPCKCHITRHCMPAAGAGAHPPLAQHVGRQEGSPGDAKPSGAGAAPALRTYSRKRGRRTPRGELLRDVRAGDAAQRPRSPLLTWLQGGAGVAPAEGGEPRAERGGGDVPRGPDGECESGPSGVCRESGGAAPAEQDAQRGGSACAARGAHGGGCRAAGAAEGSPSPRAASPDPGGAGAPRDSSGLPSGGDGSPAPPGLIRREGGGRAPAHLRFSSESPEAGPGPPAEGPSAAAVPCPAPAQARAAPGVLVGRVVAYSVTPEPSDAGDHEPDPDPDPPVAAAERASPAAAAGRPNLWERGRQAVSSFAAVIAGGRHAGDGRCGGKGADAGHAAAPDAGLPGEQAGGGAAAAAPGPLPARSLAAGGARAPQQGGAGPAGAGAAAGGAGHVAPQLSQASAQFRRNVAAHAGCGKVRTPQF